VQLNEFNTSDRDRTSQSTQKFCEGTTMPIVYGDDGIDDLMYDNTFTVYGYGNNDTLSGAVMYGSTGNDYYVVNHSNDQVIEFNNEGYDSVVSTISYYTLPENVEALFMSSEKFSAALSGTGNDLDNLIKGNQYANVLDGKAGNDRLHGGFGSDVLLGGDGDDYLVGYNSSLSYKKVKGWGEIDFLEGGNGKDTYVLNNGDRGYIAYDDVSLRSAGLQDFALIQGFNPLEDTIQLSGRATQYILDISPVEVGHGAIADTAIFFTGYDGMKYTTPELIAVIQDFSPSQLTRESLVFV
jgi:Ca2+-binding RTX toxin-like protein